MSEWTRIEDGLPKSGDFVLASTCSARGYRQTIRAMYARDRDLPCNAEHSDGFGIYDETSDEFYCPEGWYEVNSFEEVHWAVDEPVTHWMTLPDPPASTR